MDAQLFKEQYAQKGSAYFEDVVRDVQQAVEDLKHFSSDPHGKALLETLKSKYRYDFLARMDSPMAITSNLAWYYRFERNPQVFEKLLASVERVGPRDVEAFARKYFVPENQIIVTLSHEEAKAAK